AEFLQKFAQVQGSSSSKKCAFCLTRDGRAVKVQRTIFSECFYVMAMDELSRITHDTQMQADAESMMDQLVFWVQTDSSDLGRPQLPGDPPINGMAVPMMLLCLVDQLTEGRSELVEKYRALGHALEAGWFLLKYSLSVGDVELQKTAVEKFMKVPFCNGWDKQHGGLFYFLDVDGYCPTQLEWNMKLWWPHCEALIAFLMAYSHSRDPALMDTFKLLYDYTFKHFSDEEHGEWFGYLSREGEVVLDFKGGPFKGFFHVPRCLYLCEKLLDSLLEQQEA
ncbi:hypothetical protein DNTS_004963, partial [Danionella cerebrum]